MSSGDFMGRSEAAICQRRGIADRVQVVRDLQRVIARHGKIGAADQLGISTGDLDRVSERKAAISSDLMLAMYGVAGTKLASGLAAASGMDADVAKVMAAAGARVVVAPAAVPVAAVDGPADEGARLRAIMARAQAVHGGNKPTSAALGISESTWGFLKAGARPFNAAAVQILTAWAEANPEPTVSTNAAAAICPDAPADRGAVEVPPPAQDTAATATRVAPPAPVGMPLAAVAAAPAEPPVSEVALPPSISPAPAVGGDPVAAALQSLSDSYDQQVALRTEAGVAIEAVKRQMAPLQAQLAVLQGQRDEIDKVARRITLARNGLHDVLLGRTA